MRITFGNMSNATADSMEVRRKNANKNDIGPIFPPKDA